jgi:hypothetical protein
MALRLVACISPRRPGFNLGSVHLRFVVDKVALGQVFPRVLRFSPVNVIPPVLHYKEKRKRLLIIFIIGLHKKPQGCGASVASAAGPFTKQNKHLGKKLKRNSVCVCVCVQAMKGIRCTGLQILNLSISWRGVVNVTPWPLYLRGSSSGYPLNSMLGVPQSRLGPFEHRKISCPCRELTRESSSP